MVEPMFLAPVTGSPAAGDTFTLVGPEAKHAASVRRMREGEAIQVTDGKGLRLRGTVSAVEPMAVSISVIELVSEPKPQPQIVLFQALAKGDRDELAIQAATELGVWEVVPWQAERSISRWDEAKRDKGRARWQTIVTEAAKQSLRAWVPEVAQIVGSKELAKLAKDFDSVLVLEPTAEETLAAHASEMTGRIALVVGPEGGIDPRELELFTAAGAHLVRLGREVLRTSTAGMAAISVIQAGSGSWGAK